jgi:hypothetical protein
MLVLLQSECSGLVEGRKGYAAIKGLADSIHLQHDHLKLIGSTPSQWPIGMTSDKFPKLETLIGMVDATLALAGVVLANAEKAFKSAIELVAEMMLMQKLGADVSVMQTECMTAIDAIGMRLQELDLLVDLAGEHDLAITKVMK